jgi:myosin heavy subunit
MRLLLNKSQFDENVTELLLKNEEFIFTEFLRHIEGNLPYLCVTFFTFLFTCARAIPKWLTKIKRVLIDTQFSALLAHVLRNSVNRRAISDALRAMQFFANDCDFVEEPRNKFFFESAVSGLLLVNQNADHKATACTLDLEQERHDSEIHIHNLEQANRELEVENRAIKSGIEVAQKQVRLESENGIRFNEELEQMRSENQLLKQKKTQLESRHTEKKEQMKLAQDQIDALKAENENLVKIVRKLADADHENARLKESCKELHAKNADISDQLLAVRNKYVELRRSAREMDQTIQEREKEMAELQKRCEEAQERSRTLDRANEEIRGENKTLSHENSRLNGSLTEAVGKGSALSQEIARMEGSVLHLQERVRCLGVIEAKYKRKKQEWRDRLAGFDREKRKWESVAKFVHRVARVKGGVVADVYGHPELPNL